MMSSIKEFAQKTGPSVFGPYLDPAREPGAELQKAMKEVSPQGGVVNCAYIIDAVVARLKQTDPNAVAPPDQDGNKDDVAERFDTEFKDSNFQDAFKDIEKGGDGTVGLVVIEYDGGGGHVVTIANDNGKVGIVEAQSWGPSDPPEVITDPARANERYNSDGKSDVLLAILD